MLSQDKYKETHTYSEPDTFLHYVASFLKIHESPRSKHTHANTPVKEEVAILQQSHMICGSKWMVVFKPGHQCSWSAVWRSAGDRDIFSPPHCQVCRMLGETPVHLWKNATHAFLMCKCLSGNDYAVYTGSQTLMLLKGWHIIL